MSQSLNIKEEALARFKARKNKPVILFVDDDKPFLDVASQILKDNLDKHFRIETAQGGEDALQVIKEQLEDGREIAVIVSDQTMPPGIPGDEFLVEAHKLAPRTRKILLTGNSQMQSVNIENAINNANLYRYLRKMDNDTTDLLLTVKEAAYSYLMGITVEEQNRNLKTLHQVSQDIARKFELPDLLHDLLLHLLDFSNAEKIVLAIRRKEGLFIEAIASAANKKVETMNGAPLEDANEYPLALLQNVENNKKIINLSNAADGGEYANLPYIQNNKVKSALVVPVLNGGKLTGIYYFENNSFDGVFTDERVEMIEILAGASAVAIENLFSMGSKDELASSRTDELLDRLKELQKINEQKEKIINILSHDIRGPLSGIQQMAKLLQDGTAGGDAATVQKWGGMIQDSVGSVLSMANDILDLAKLESGATILNKTKFELNAYLKTIISAFEPLCTVKGVKINLNVSGSVTLNADQSKLTQSINNLLSNSIKFTPKGKSVSISAEQKTEGGKAVAVIEVADEGIGIPPEDVPFIFEKFNKVQRSGTKGEKGTGLGMSIAKEIVELHGGTIAVKSTVNVGTIFTLTLPLD